MQVHSLYSFGLTWKGEPFTSYTGAAHVACWGAESAAVRAGRWAGCSSGAGADLEGPREPCRGALPGPDNPAPPQERGGRERSRALRLLTAPFWIEFLQCEGADCTMRQLNRSTARHARQRCRCAPKVNVCSGNELKNNREHAICEEPVFSSFSVRNRSPSVSQR